MITTLLTPERITWDLALSHKIAVLDRISALFAQQALGISQTAILECLLAREQMGSTGLGHGIALPHGRIAAQTTVVGAFVKLAVPIAFDAQDQQPVDLLFALLMPLHYEHLYLLSSLSLLFKDSQLCYQLRQAHNPLTVMELLFQWEQAEFNQGEPPS